MVVKVMGYEFYVEKTGCSYDIARRHVATGEVKYPWVRFGVLQTQAEAEAELYEKAQGTPGAVVFGRPTQA